jgi:mannitol PTS system EIICBA or EIICB component
LLPLLIGYTGGKMVYDTRGGVVGAVATFGVIAGTGIPMFMGAMIMGPLGGWSMKKIDAIWDGKIKPGFEMLVNNFSAGIWGGILATVGFFALSPVLSWIANRFGDGVEFLVDNNLLPLASLVIEPAKVLFLNNALNQGVLTPLGLQESAESGKSILFLLEANPAAGIGLLLAYSMFGKGLAKASAPGAAIIHFFGGIHEVYFPFVLMKPKLIVAMIAGGATQILINVIFSSGLRSPASPGSVFAVYIAAPTDITNLLGVTLSIIGGAAASFAVAAIILKTDKTVDAEDQLVDTTAQMESLKGRRSSVASVLTGGAATAVAAPIRRIVFACDAGMGSSAMGASALRKQIESAGFTDVTVVNKAIANLTDDYDVVVSHRDLTDRAKQSTPSARHVSVDNFMGNPRYQEIVELIERSRA